MAGEYSAVAVAWSLEGRTQAILGIPTQTHESGGRVGNGKMRTPAVGVHNSESHNSMHNNVHNALLDGL